MVPSCGAGSAQQISTQAFPLVFIYWWHYVGQKRSLLLWEHSTAGDTWFWNQLWGVYSPFVFKKGKQTGINWVEFLCSCPLPRPSNFWENTIPTKSKRSTLPYNSLPLQELIYYLYRTISTKKQTNKKTITEAVGCSSPVALLEIQAGVTSLELSGYCQVPYFAIGAFHGHGTEEGCTHLPFKRQRSPEKLQQTQLYQVFLRVENLSCLKVFLACLCFY